MRILFIGDVVGNMGVAMIEQYLPQIKKELKPQLTIVNGENSTVVGRGINRRSYKKIMSSGADLITLGNHAWNNDEVFDLLAESNKLIRPLNYPGVTPGSGHVIVNVNGNKVAVINLQGRVFMDPIDDPFAMAKELVDQLKSEAIDNIIIDFHAEVTSEKIALARYLDGQISAIVGTHTHVQTSDNQILPNKTAFMTDVGMTGPADGMLGMEPHNVIERFLNQRPIRYNVLETGKSQISGCYIDINEKNGHATAIKPVFYKN